MTVVAEQQWQVSCRDAAGRRRDLMVRTDTGSVVLTAPPGETATLTPMEVGRLRAALRAAVVATTPMQA